MKFRVAPEPSLVRFIKEDFFILYVKKIILYRTESCPWYHRTKEFFDSHKVKYEEVYVDRDRKKQRR